MCPADENCTEYGVLETFVRAGRSMSCSGRLYVGRCAGNASHMFSEAFASGAMSAGIDVFDIGVAPAPTLSFSSKDKGDSAMICSFDDVPSVNIRARDGILSDPSRVRHVDKDVPFNVGSVTNVGDAIWKHKDAVMTLLSDADCPVVIDCSSDCPSLIVPELLSEMGCDVVSVNSTGRLTSKGIEENDLKDLMTIAAGNTGGIGIAVNYDGTRISAVDESNRYIPPELLLALFVKYLEPKKLVVSVTTSMMIDDLSNCEIIRSGATDRSVGSAVGTNDADFGGSPLGSFFFPKLSLCPDAVYASALLSKIAGEGRLADMIDELPEYQRNKDQVRYDGDRQEISEKISESVNALEYEHLIEKDGWRVEMEFGWFLIRFSSKEPVIRFNAEARDKVYLVMLMDVAKGLIENALKEL
jgi:Phosphomannomutase